MPHTICTGYTMVYTSVGNSALFLYKGREGILQKIDEINMEVRSPRRHQLCHPSTAHSAPPPFPPSSILRPS